MGDMSNNFSTEQKDFNIRYKFIAQPYAWALGDKVQASYFASPA